MSHIERDLHGPLEPSRQSSDPRVIIYRVVDGAELAYLQVNGNYGPNPNGSGKYFSWRLVGAKAFAAHPINTGRTITETTLPQSIVNQGFSMTEPGPNSPGPSVHVDEPDLPMIYAAMTPIRIVT